MPAVATMTGVFASAAAVSMHHMGTATEPHHEIEQRRKEQQRAQAFHRSSPFLVFGLHDVSPLRSWLADSWSYRLCPIAMIVIDRWQFDGQSVLREV